MRHLRSVPLLFALLLFACSARHPGDHTMTPSSEPIEPSIQTEVATFGAGCFWCVEAVLQQVDGILRLDSGYMGGDVENPTYQQVCGGDTGHAEVVKVTFDPARISYQRVLSWFWKLHDPTTLDRQGNDVGTQYRSAIFYHSEAQREAAEASKKQVEEAAVFSAPVVTEITPASTFYAAEDYHQDYYRRNKSQSYCQFVISPKLDKLGLEK
jgi:peptide-methionine (S)-S-oxide reductase